MSYIFKGNLCGRLCANCEEDLSNVQVKLYRLREDQRETVLATANPKNTFYILSEKEVKVKEKSLIAETQTGEDGSFQFELSDDQKYTGEAFEVDVYIKRAPGQEKQSKDSEPVQFTITTYQPHWKQTEEGYIAVWEYCISHRFWCKIRELLGAYVICGQVLDCETEKPIPKVRVMAFDRDWLQDDELGTAITDSSGHFRIYYSENDFIPGTFLDIELIGGPDLYFRVETTLGAPLLNEDPSRGRDPDRENVGACFCTTLCLSDVPPEPGPEDVLPFFSHIGSYDYEDDINTGTGLTVGSDRAFFRNLRLNGTLSKKINGSDLEYRFEVHETDASGNFIGSGWEPVLESQLGKMKIGTLQRANPDFPATSPNPIKNVDYVIKPNQPDEKSVDIINDSGIHWIQVPQESDNPLSSTGFFTPNHNLISLNSRSIASFSDVDLTGLVTGNSVTDAHPLVENKHFAIRMVVREKGNSGTENIAGLCGHIAVNNTLYDGIDSHPDWYSNIRNNQLAVAMVDIAQLQGSGCLRITTDLDVVFTAAHPNLGSVNINMTGPGGPYSFTLPALSAPGDLHGSATPVFSVSDLEPCAYIVNMSVQVLLTDGDDVPSNLHDEIAFCKR